MLDQLTITDFKSFESATLTLGQLTLVVGSNATGKSNLRDALRFLHGIGLGYSLTEILGGKYGPGGIQQWAGIRGGARAAAFNGGQAFGFTVGLSKPSLKYNIVIDVEDERHGPLLVAESLYSGPMLFDSNPDDAPLVQDSKHEIKIRHPRGGNHRKVGKFSKYSSHTPVVSQIPHQSAETARLRAQCEAVLAELAAMRFLDLEPNAMRESSPPGQTVLGDRGENLSSVIQAICERPKTKQQLLSWVRSLTPMDAVDFDFQYDLQGRVLLFLKEASGRMTSAVNASDGTLRFLALVSALLSPDTGRLYFFEEFDNGIHPTRLHLLLNLVQQACKEQKVQVVGTTHNPALLSFLEEDALKHAHLTYRPEGAPDTRLTRILKLPNAERVLKTQDLGLLHASGWLEDAALFGDQDEDDTGADL